jgi:hypothetical protein
MIQTEFKLKEEATKVICDSCQADCGHPNEGNTLAIRATWGYGSMFDCDKWSADLCSNCADNLRKLLPGVIKVVEYDPG